MAVPSLPNWGYGLYLDPEDMMQRVFGPDKYTRERQKTADTQHAADFGLKQEQMELQKREQAASLLQFVSLMPDGPEKTQLLQQIYGTLGVTQDQPAQGTGLDVPPPREADGGLPGWMGSVLNMGKQLFTPPSQGNELGQERGIAPIRKPVPQPQQGSVLAGQPNEIQAALQAGQSMLGVPSPEQIEQDKLKQLIGGQPSFADSILQQIGQGQQPQQQQPKPPVEKTWRGVYGNLPDLPTPPDWLSGLMQLLRR